jgi:hypothetical protein
MQHVWTKLRRWIGTVEIIVGAMQWLDMTTALQGE